MPQQSGALMAAIRILGSFLAATAVAFLFAAAFNTQMVIAALESAGAQIGTDDRIAMTLNDIVGLAPQLGLVIAIGLGVGFLIASQLKRVLTPLAPIAYPLAGAAAIALALTLMGMAFDGITPIAGVRSALGFGLLCLAGAIGGLVFSILAEPRQ